MRKPIVLITALIIYSIYSVLVGEAWALRIQLGHHSANDIRSTCGAVGGDFFTFPSGSYGCSKLCGEGGTSSCVVSCTSNGNCTGECPACGGDQPILRGSNEVTRVLNNLRTAKRYPAKRY
jgi:hypothetical protein